MDQTNDKKQAQPLQPSQKVFQQPYQYPRQGLAQRAKSPQQFVFQQNVAENQYYGQRLGGPLLLPYSPRNVGQYPTGQLLAGQTYQPGQRSYSQGSIIGQYSTVQVPPVQTVQVPPVQTKQVPPVQTKQVPPVQTSGNIVGQVGQYPTRQYLPGITYQSEKPQISSGPIATVKVENALTQSIKGETRIEKRPYEKAIIEYDAVLTTEYVPREKKITDYYQIQYQTEYVPQVYKDKYIDYVPVERYQERIEYIPQVYQDKYIEYKPQDRFQERIEYNAVERKIEHPPKVEQYLQQPPPPTTSYIQNVQQQYTYAPQQVQYVQQPVQSIIQYAQKPVNYGGYQSIIQQKPTQVQVNTGPTVVKQAQWSYQPQTVQYAKRPGNFVQQQSIPLVNSVDQKQPEEPQEPQPETIQA